MGLKRRVGRRDEVHVGRVVQFLVRYWGDKQEEGKGVGTFCALLRSRI
jgi:hypothetical protein